MGKARRTRTAKQAHGPQAPDRELDAAAVAHALAPWFLAHARDLPFRGTTDPWAIWVSEVMLQQTRVDTVVRYWPRFVARFPDAKALAEAAEDEVLAHWSGLGYYRRARMLHRGARWVMAEHAGSVPADEDALRAIPGVGPYTAGAIGSIAFDRPIPLVDGNVARVLSRLLAIEDPALQGATARAHPARVRSILEHGRPRVLAQALMELGALVCTPRNPACERCPLATQCGARAQGSVDRIPAPRVRKASPHEHWAALVVRHSGGIVLERRPSTGLLADLWCLPMVPLPDRGAAPDLAAIHERVPGAQGPARSLDAGVEHVFTHRVWTLRLFEVAIRGRPRLTGVPPAHVHAWHEDAPVPGGMPTITRKLLAAAKKAIDGAAPRRRARTGRQATV